MKKLNIGIDIDGTVTEPYYWLPRANRYFNTNVRPEEVTDYAIDKVLGIQREDYDRFYAVYGKALHSEARIRPGVSEVLNRFAPDYGLHFITAREEAMRGVSLDWLRKYYIPLDSISLVGGRNKSHQAKKLRCGLFLEDCYDNALMLAEAGIEVLLLNCNYNQGPLPQNVTRVKNWVQIRHIIENISKQNQTVSYAV